MATLADLRSLVRDQLDFTTADLPDARLDQYFREGYNLLIDLERRWPFFEVSYTLTSVVGTQAYALTSIGSGDLREVVSIVDNTSVGLRLRQSSQDTMEEIWAAAGSNSGQSMNWSLWAGSIYLWPTPSTAVTYQVRGYRKATDWVSGGTGASPDCDDRFHLTLVDYAMGRVYFEQEDPGMAQMWLDHFDSSVERVRAEVMRQDAAEPSVLNGGYGVLLSTYKWMQRVVNAGHAG